MKPDQMIDAQPAILPLKAAREEPRLPIATYLPSASEPHRETGWRARLAEFLGRGGATGLVLAVLDAILWLGVYTTLVSVRRYYALDDPVAAATLIKAGAGGVQLTVCMVQFTALALCLFIVGGYDRRTSYLSLGYMSEHLIALAAAGVLGGLFIYAGAVFNEIGVRPSRGAFLSSLMAFAPLSLVSRRALGQMLRAHMARSFLVVLGKGKSAWQFHESYRADGEHQPRL